MPWQPPLDWPSLTPFLEPAALDFVTALCPSTDDAYPVVMELLRGTLANTPPTLVQPLVVSLTGWAIVNTARPRILRSRFRMIRRGLQTLMEQCQLLNFADVLPTHFRSFLRDQPPRSDPAFDVKCSFISMYKASERDVQIFHSLSPEHTDLMQRYGLPDSNGTLNTFETDQQRRKREREERERAARERLLDLAPVVEHFDSIFHAVCRRTALAQQMNTDYQMALTSIDVTNITAPIEYETRVPDSPEVLRFRILTTKLLTEIRGIRYRPLAAEPHGLFVEFLGTTLPASLTSAFWVAELFRCRVHSGLQAAFESQYGYPTKRFLSRHDGVLNNHDSLQTMLTHTAQADLQQGAPIRCFFCMQPFYIATMFGATAYHIAMGTALRAHEIIQLQLGPGLMRRPAARATLRRLARPEGVLMRYRAKGDKGTRARPARESWRHVPDRAIFLLDEFWASQGQPRDCLPFEALFDSAQVGKYGFQYGGRVLTAQSLTACLHLMLHDLGLVRNDGQVVLPCFHLLRHAVANRLRMVGCSEQEIAQFLGHSNLRVTASYGRLTTQQVADQFIDLSMRIQRSIKPAAPARDAT